MDIKDIHEFRYDIIRRATYVKWYWRCTCGAFAADDERSKSAAEIAHHWHRYPDAQPMPHTMTPTTGGFGGPGWVCSCGKKSRPEGHRDDRRALQTFNRHLTTVNVKWVRRYHAHQLRHLTPRDMRSREAIIRWYEKPPDMRAEHTKNFMATIL